MKKIAYAFFFAVALFTFAALAQAADKSTDESNWPTFNVCWSRYTGWEFHGYMGNAGILDKWANRYQLKIKLTYIGSYAESVNQYTLGTYDACAMTNMDALYVPAIGGVDSTALYVGDYSNDNDGVVSKVAKKMQDLRGQKIYMVQPGVSQYLTSRCLALNSMQESDITITAVDESEILNLFLNANTAQNVVTWNPYLMQVRNARNAKMLCSSSQIPEEILDLMVVRTSAPEALKKALTGAWYETMQIMRNDGPKEKEAVAYMAEQAGGTEAEFRAQLATTYMYYDPQSATDVTRTPKFKQTMKFMRDASFDHGLFGEGKDRDYVGIQFPDGSLLGNPKNVKLRFDATYMQLAADGKL